MSVTGVFMRHRAAVYLAVALLTLGGLWALFTLPAGIYPEVTYPRIVVLARGGTFEADAMTVAVTRPLEEALSGILGLRRIRTLTVRGSAELSLDFRPNADMAVRAEPGAGPPQRRAAHSPPDLDLSAERLTPSVFPMLQYELTGADPLVLRDLAEFTVRPRLAGLPDVGEVAVEGGRVREITVQLDPARLVANRVSVAGGGGHLGHRSGGSGGPDRPGLPPVRHHRLGPDQHAGGGGRGRDPERAPAGARGRPRQRELRRRRPVSDRRRQRPARRAGEHRPPAERQYAAAAGGGPSHHGLDPAPVAGRVSGSNPCTTRPRWCGTP